MKIGDEYFCGREVALWIVGFCLVLIGAMAAGAVCDHWITFFQSGADRAGTTQDVTIIGVDIPSQRDGEINYCVVLKGMPYVHLSEGDYFSIANRDLPVECTMSFSDGGWHGTIVAFHSR